MYVHYPDTVMSGLIKIGSVMAILRIGLLLHYLHRRSYELSIKSIAQQQIDQSQDFEIKQMNPLELYSLKTFANILDK